MQPGQCACVLVPAVVAQADVEQDRIGRQALDGLPRRGRAARFADDGVAARLEQRARDHPEHRLVVDDQDAHHTKR